MSAATVSNVRPDKTRKSALSPAALVAFKLAPAPIKTEKPRYCPRRPQGAAACFPRHSAIRCRPLPLPPPSAARPRPVTVPARSLRRTPSCLHARVSWGLRELRRVADERLTAQLEGLEAKKQRTRCGQRPGTIRRVDERRAQTRCSNHGGLSTRRISEAQRARWKRQRTKNIGDHL